MHVADVMTTDVLTVGADTPLIEIARLMLDHSVGAVPVVDAGTVIGIVARSDVLPFEDDPDRALRTAADVMSRDVMVVHEAMPVSLAARALALRGIKRAPVLRVGKLVGIVSESDLLRTYARADADVAIDVERALRAPALGAHLEPIDFSVQNAVVTLTGAVRGDAERSLALRVVRGIEGVVEVDDRLTVEAAAEPNAHTRV